jgi:hypothetical protein
MLRSTQHSSRCERGTARPGSHSLEVCWRPVSLAHRSDLAIYAPAKAYRISCNKFLTVASSLPPISLHHVLYR